MKTFKEFHKPKEFIAFSNAGGRLGQYDRFDYTESSIHGQGGGPKESVDENLNPRKDPRFIKSSGILQDPEKDNINDAEECMRIARAELHGEYSRLK